MATILAALLLLHAPDGRPIVLHYTTETFTIQPAPPGYRGKTMIEIGSSRLIVRESFCFVLRKLGGSC